MTADDRSVRHPLNYREMVFQHLPLPATIQTDDGCLGEGEVSAAGARNVTYFTDPIRIALKVAA